MPPLLTHIFIPLFILIIFSEQPKLSKKMIFALCFFGIFSDLDVFIFHRTVLHNVFILFIPLCFYVFWKDIKLSGIMAFYMISHVILDLFNSGVYLLYPFYNKVIYLMIGISYENSIITPIYKIIIQSGLSSEFIESPMISSENVATILLIIIMLIVVIIDKHKSIYTKKQSLT